MSSSPNPTTEASPTAEGLSREMQQAVYAAILPKLDTCKKCMHYALSLPNTGKEASYREALDSLAELEAGYLAGSEGDLNRLVTLVTLLEPDMPKMQAMLNRQAQPDSLTRIVVRRTVTTTAYRQPSKGVIASFLDWIF